MGGYILFHAAKYDAGRYRALLAIVARDFEPRRWAIEAILRYPGVSFNRMIPIFVRGFMAPQDPPGHVDEVAWVYESGNPRTLRGDLHFAVCDCDSRPFLGELDVVRTPLYLFGGAYDWSCTEIHSGVMKRAQPGIHEIRMAGIGHFPPDVNPEAFKKYFLPVLLDAVEKTS
jgi:pimeloyl-ACP methyl ester carboxylesterase